MYLLVRELMIILLIIVTLLENCSLMDSHYVLHIYQHQIIIT